MTLVAKEAATDVIEKARGENSVVNATETLIKRKKFLNLL